MANTPSARGIKALELRNVGLNRIACYTISPQFAVAVIGRINAGADLNAELRLPVYANQTLLWTYAQEFDVTTITFGLDVHIGDGKIGHGALTQRAMIAGEIKPNGPAAWIITNESGAWGAMGGADGKTDQLRIVAAVMHTALGLTVTSGRAFSRTGWKRAIQSVFR